MDGLVLKYWHKIERFPFQVNKLNSTRSHTSIQVSFDFIKVETASSGSESVQGIKEPGKLRGATVVVVEDIADTGRTMLRLTEALSRFQPKQVLVACLLRKRSRVRSHSPHFIGFEVPNKLLVGYALDFNDHFRDLLHICILSREGQAKFARPSPPPRIWAVPVRRTDHPRS